MTDVEQIRQDMAAFAEFIVRLGEVPNEEFDRLSHERLWRIEELANTLPKYKEMLMKELFTIAADELDQGIMNRHTRHKPLGYAGDHIMLDMIYDQRADSPGKGKLWDEFYHRQSAPQAVRNRKSFFVETFRELCSNRKAPSVLDIACGPCRDVAEAIKVAGITASGTSFHCSDMDRNAITYAQAVVSGGGGISIFLLGSRQRLPHAP